MSSAKEKFKCCNSLKTEALKISLKQFKFKTLLLAIRRDELGVRAKERYFSPRATDFTWNYENQPIEPWDLYKSKLENEQHFRIHPMLHWTELDIWRYIKKEKIPMVDLYFFSNALTVS